MEISCWQSRAQPFICCINDNRLFPGLLLWTVRKTFTYKRLITNTVIRHLCITMIYSIIFIKKLHRNVFFS